MAPVTSRDTGLYMKVLSVPLWAWLVIVAAAVAFVVSLIVMRRRKAVIVFDEEKLEMPLAPLTEGMDLRRFSMTP